MSFLNSKMTEVLAFVKAMLKLDGTQQNTILADDETIYSSAVKIEESMRESDDDDDDDNSSDAIAEFIGENEKKEKEELTKLMDEASLILSKKGEITSEEYDKLNELYTTILRNSEISGLEFNKIIELFTPSVCDSIKTYENEITIEASPEIPGGPIKINIYEQLKRSRDILDVVCWPMSIVIKRVRSSHQGSLIISSNLEGSRALTFGCPTKIIPREEIISLIKEKKNSVGVHILDKQKEEAPKGENFYQYKNPINNQLYGETIEESERAIRERNTLMAAYVIPFCDLQTTSEKKNFPVYIKNNLATTILLQTIIWSKSKDITLKKIADAAINTTDCNYYVFQRDQILNLKEYFTNISKRRQLSDINLEIRDFLSNELGKIKISIQLEIVYRT